MRDMRAVDAGKAPGVASWIIHGSGHDTPIAYTFPNKEGADELEVLPRSLGLTGWGDR
jgi:hypothetical protein